MLSLASGALMAATGPLDSRETLRASNNFKWGNHYYQAVSNSFAHETIVPILQSIALAKCL